MVRSFDQLLCAERVGGRLGERDAAERNEYDADFDKLIFSASVRALMGKTQVFDTIAEAGRSRNRLTHSLEVASIARSLGVAVGARMIAYAGLNGASTRFAFWRVDPREIGSVCAAGGIAHDIGLPPLGHVGEEVIGDFFARCDYRWLINKGLDAARTDYEDLVQFEGNALNLRMQCRVDGWRGERGGLNLTAATLATMKYPYPRRGGRKYGVLSEDVGILAWIADRTGMQPDSAGGFKRHPFSWLVEASDDIAWCMADAEDAANIGALPLDVAETLLTEMLNRDDLEECARVDPGPRRLAFMRSRSIRRLVDGVVEIYPEVASALEDGTLDPAQGDLLDRSRHGAAIREIKRLSREMIYRSDRVQAVREARSRSMSRALERIMGEVEATITKPGRATPILDRMLGWRMGGAGDCPVQRAIDGVVLLGDGDIVAIGE